MPLPQLKKQHIILIGGVVLLAVAFMALNTYVQQQRALTETALKKKYQQAQANQTPVLVAKKDIPRGQEINPDDLITEIIPNNFVQPQAVTSVNRIVGMAAVAPIKKGEQITLSKLSQQRAGGDLAAVTPVGKRALTIALDEVSAFDGMIKAGNYVDVIAIIPVPMALEGGKTTVQMTTVPMFQNVLVLAVGQDIGGYSPQQTGRTVKKEESRGPILVTLALGPQEANIITFVQEQGSKIRLVLRSPTDAKTETLQLVTWDSLFQYIIPREQKPKDETPPPPQETVEVFRGAAREQIPITN